MANRHFAYTVKVTDSGNHLVDVVRGMSVVTDDAKSDDAICRSIVSDLPSHLRRPSYSCNVTLTVVP